MLNERLRRALVVLTAVGVLPVAAACDAPAKPAAAPPSAPAQAAPSPGVSATPSLGASARPVLEPHLVTDPEDEVLVPVRSGAGAGRTPSFAVTTGVFTVRIACVGGGTATLFTDSEKHPVVCDDRMHRIHTVTDSREADVRVRATATQRWSLTVVVTDAVRRT